MKELIKKILKEYEKERKILVIPSLSYFNNDWNLLQKFLQLNENPFYAINDNLDLYDTSIKSLGNLTSVGGYLDLYGTLIESLGNLKSVGGYLNLYGTPISKKYSEEEIRQMVNVEGGIFM